MREIDPQHKGTSDTLIEAIEANVPEEWRAFREWNKAFQKLPGETRRKAQLQGVWPEGTEQINIDLYTRLTRYEKLKGHVIGSYPPIDEVMERDPEEVRREDDFRLVELERQGRENLLAEIFGKPKKRIKYS